MPHLTLQHSANMSPQRISQACEALHGAMVETGVFPLAGIRVRAFASVAYAIADKHPRNAFVDMVLRMAAGRSPEVRKATGDKLMQVAEACFAEELAGQHFALSLEIVEINPLMSWKTNPIHDRMKANA